LEKKELLTMRRGKRKTPRGTQLKKETRLFGKDSICRKNASRGGRDLTNKRKEHITINGKKKNRSESARQSEYGRT